MKTKITPNMLPAFQGVIPPMISTVSLAGIPNLTCISHLQYIDEITVALSYQFLNKTWGNIFENPFFTVVTTCPESGTVWKLNLSFQEEQKQGPIFDEMDMVITAIASTIGMEAVFKLKSAIICSVNSIETLILNGKIS